MSTPNVTPLAVDARNRAWRTLLQGLGIDILVAVGFLLYDALQAESPEYRLLLLSLLKTVLQVVAAFLMRLKTSIAPPPSPVPPPNDPPPHDDDVTRDERGRFKSDKGESPIYFIGLILAAIGLILVVVAATREVLSVPGLILLAVGAVCLFARPRVR